jgi:PAS domain S-box-containing protein
MNPASENRNRTALEAALTERNRELERLRRQEESRRREFDEQRTALLSMLEDLQASRAQIERARKEWTDAFDAVRDPIFLHDQDFRVVRANRAYAEAAGMAVEEVIGKRYWEVFPKNTGPMPICARHMERAEEEEEEEEEVTLPDGAVFVSRAFIVRDDQGRYLHSIHILEDITAQRGAEAERRRLSEALRQAASPMLLLDLDLKITFANPALGALTGRALETLVGRSIETLVAPERRERIPMIKQAVDTQGMWSGEVAIQTADGGPIPVHLSAGAIRDVQGRTSAYVGSYTDLRAIKQAEQAVAESEEKFRRIAAAAQDAILMMDNDGCVAFWNPAAERIFGYRTEEMLGRNVHRVLAPQRYHADCERGFAAFRETGTGPVIGKNLELVARRKDGTEFPVELSVSALKLKDRWHAVGVLRDITARKRAEEALRASEAELKEAQRVARLGSWSLDTETGHVVWTEEIYRIFGLDPAQSAPAYEAHPRILAPESYARMNTAIEKTRQTGEPYELDLELIRPDGTRKWITARGEARRDDDGKIIGLRGTALDITERKQTEQALRRSNRALAALSACNTVLIHADTEQAMLEEMCRAVVETGGYRMVWIGYAEHDEAKSVRPMAHAGAEEGYLDSLQITWADTERGRGPTGTAIRTGRLKAAHNIQTDPDYEPWREQALKRGYASSIALPLKEADGGVFGAINIFAPEPDAFDAEEMRLLTELADDLAFGILTLRVRTERNRLQEEHWRAGERLKAALTATIRAIALTVEKRDPYTAGHQHRVAELCVAIGREMGLDQDPLEGLRLGATIHDIGKIYIPAEILNRPGKLTPAEFEIIKSHPEVGYDIIKDVKFPWPVAQMILQHHERMDGSGYPAGLKGEAIIPEARILAVADVVEAMSAHRPYRPAVGLERALAEITGKRGSAYDTQVVDACLSLIKEKGFTLRGE